MILKTRGKALNITESLVGRITRNILDIDQDSIYINENYAIEEIPACLGVLTKDQTTLIHTERSIINSVPDFSHLFDGDIVALHSDGYVNTLYQKNSIHNSILTTERCNSNCLMCSQPPKDRDDTLHLFNIHQKLIPLIPKDCLELGITGGEPTLMGERFFKNIELLKECLPDTEIHVLTNGRSFAWYNLAERLGELQYDRLMLGIPIYADYYQLHDYIVQARDAFDQTILGIHNLAKFNQRIEIRVVLHKLSIPRLTRLARYIYKNLPFVEHITFMGLEYIGYTPYNIEKLWIDPYDYVDELGEAVEFLSGQGMNVSIYNSQLCVMPESLWPYCRKSISDWKNSYLPECQNCSKLDDCGGLFTWNLKKHSEKIRAFS